MKEKRLVKEVELYRLKHDTFSLLFKIKSSLEILGTQEKEFSTIALESLSELEKLLDRLFLLDKVLRGEYRIRKEPLYPCSLAAQVFCVNPSPSEPMEGDNFLFTKALEAIKDTLKGEWRLRCSQNSLILEGSNPNSEIESFYVNFCLLLLSKINVNLQVRLPKIEIRWGKC